MALSSFSRKWVSDPGDINLECVVIEVALPVNMHDYVVIPMAIGGPDEEPADATTDYGWITANEGSQRDKDHFWFPEHQVPAGEWVILYTKRGDDCVVTEKEGSVLHLFHWNRMRPVWGKSTNVIAMLRVADCEYWDQPHLREARHAPALEPTWSGEDP